MTTAIVVIGVLWLAYNNGANDNFKGVATLYGSGVDYHRALAWATVATFAGSVASILVAKQLVLVFSGSGLIPARLLGENRTMFVLAAAAGGAILLATILGMPTSTTHALAGALLGVASASSSLSTSISEFLNIFAKPLLVGPLLAVGLTTVIYYVFRRSGLEAHVSRNSCACVEQTTLAQEFAAPGGVLARSSDVGIFVRGGTAEQCADTPAPGQIARVTARSVSDAAHYASAGAVCFSRALNDTPKIAALMLASAGAGSGLTLATVGLAMLTGGILHSRRVAETMSRRITALDTGQGLCANLATSTLVLLASRWGVPVSTTHVSCGAIFGIGLAGGKAQWGTIAAVLLTWCTTLPLAALVSGALFMSSEALLR